MSPADGRADLEAKRQQLARLEAEAEASAITRESLRIRDRANELRNEIRRIEQGSEAHLVDQPRELTRQQIVDKVRELVTQSGVPYLSLVRLRGSLPHIKHEEVTAALKELDRARIIQLNPDSNQKAIPREAYDSAVILGGERKLLVSLGSGA